MVLEFNPNTNIILQNQSVCNQKQSKIDVTCPVESVETSIENSDASNAIANNAKVFIGQKFALNNVSSKKFLRNEISKLKDSDNNPIFDSSTIEEIINSKNNNQELFKIVDLLKSNNVVLDKNTLKELLSSEKTTSDEIEEKIGLLKELESNPLFAEIKEEFGEETLASATLANYIDTNIEQMRENVETLTNLKKSAPDLYQKVLSENSYFNLRCILDAKIDKNAFKNILESKLLDDKLPNSSLLSLLKSETPPENINKNVELLTYFRKHPGLQFLFDENTGLKSYDIANILQKETPLTIDVNKKEGVIKLVNELTHIITAQDVIEILLKDKNDLYEDGKELVKLALENNLSSYETRNLLCKYEFNKGTEAIKKITFNPNVFKEVGPALANSGYCNTEEFKNLVDTLDYATQKPELNNYIRILYFTLDSVLKSSEHEKENILKDLSACKNMIDKSAEILGNLPSKVADKVKCAIFERLRDGKKLELKEENIQFLNELYSDEILSDIALRLSDNETTDFITKEANIETLKRNIVELKELKESGICRDYSLTELVLYEGDLKSISKKYKELLDKHGDDVSLQIDKDNNNIIFGYQQEESHITETYNKDLKHLYTEVFNQMENDSFEIIFSDQQNKSQHTANIQDFKEDYLSTANKLTSRYFDNNGNVIKTKFYNQSSLDGSVNIKELTPQGKLKTIAGVRETSQGTFIEKELTSCDGTKSYVKSYIDLQGNENYTYKIIDKEGKELLNHVRQSKNIDENTKITSVNGKDYKVFNAEDYIEITDMTSGEKTKIDFNKLFKEKRVKSMEKMLQSLPADELLKLNKHIKSINWTHSSDSCFKSTAREIISGSNKFIFEHELGHAKDLTKDIDYTTGIENGDISGNAKLQEIFKEELANLKQKESECVRKVLNYFTAGAENHYGGELGGLQEIVAEVNAIQTTAQAHPLLQMRTQMLQEHFPKTIAYLINNHLAC